MYLSVNDNHTDMKINVYSHIENQVTKMNVHKNAHFVSFSILIGHLIFNAVCTIYKWKPLYHFNLLLTIYFRVILCTNIPKNTTYFHANIRF